MNSFLSVLIGLSILVAPVTPAPSTFPDIAKAKNSIVQIGDEHSACTAFSSRINRLITAGHCVEGKEIGSTDEYLENGTPLKLVYVDKDHDIAVLETPVMFYPLELGDEPKLGEPIWIMGYGIGANGMFFYILPAAVMSLNDTPLRGWHDMLTYSSNAVEGMSGGPILNSSGKVVSSVVGGANINGPIYFTGTGTVYSALKKAYKQ